MLLDLKSLESLNALLPYHLRPLLPRLPRPMAMQMTPRRLVKSPVLLPSEIMDLTGR